MEIIQQWQYDGSVHPEMLADDAFALAREIGITSVQSYVTWANVEPEPGRFDFSVYDPLVEKLSRRGLGWVPFLILGPSYSIPGWFENSAESLHASCLEHGRDCGIQSIWNPHLGKRVDGFIRSFHAHYGDVGVVRSVLLGISGNWGESIYPASGGFVKEDHMHLGWWCGDEHALVHFRRSMAEKFGTVGALNTGWGRSYGSFEEIGFPGPSARLTLGHRLHHAGYRLLGWLPAGAKSCLKSIAARPRRCTGISGETRQWVDFVQWYVDSMTGWVRFWLGTARKYFIKEPLYIVTGGDGNPMMGADFFAQAKAASEYDAGLRVTSLTDSYPESYFLSRLVVSPCGFYGSYHETEEAGLHSTKGISMRVFDAVTSGARGIYFKNLVGYGRDLCTGRYYAPGRGTSCADVFKENSSCLTVNYSAERVAVLYPTTAIFLDYNTLSLLKDFCARLREHTGFDLLDENMLKDGALEGYRVLIKSGDYFIPPEAESVINGWVDGGGLYIDSGNGRKSGVHVRGSGKVIALPSGRNLADSIHETLRNGDGLNRCGGRLAGEMPEGLYASVCTDRTYIYNSRKRTAIVRIDGKDITVAPYSIAEAPFSTTQEEVSVK